MASRKSNATSEELMIGQTRATELNRVTSLFILRRTQEINNKYLPPKGCSIALHESFDILNFSKTSNSSTLIYFVTAFIQTQLSRVGAVFRVKSAIMCVCVRAYVCVWGHFYSSFVVTVFQRMLCYSVD